MLSCNFCLVLVSVVPLTELTSSQQWWPISDKIRLRIKGALEKHILRVSVPLRGYTEQLTLKGFFTNCLSNTQQVSSPWSLNRKQELPSSVFYFSVLFGQSFLRREHVEPLLGALISSLFLPSKIHWAKTPRRRVLCSIHYRRALKWLLQNVLVIWKYRKYKNNSTPLSSITNSVTYNYGRTLPAFTSTLRRLSYKYFFITFSFLFFWAYSVSIPSVTNLNVPLAYCCLRQTKTMVLYSERQNKKAYQ